MSGNRGLWIAFGVLAVAVVLLCAVLGLIVLLQMQAGPADDSWSRIQKAGKIVVGTSADYPPFEHIVSDDFQVDGFDIALMNEVGQRLGLAVEYHNFAFDGLGGALQLGQIDVAVAALSVTPEREAVVDFTNVYLVTEDGVLAHQDSTINVGSAADLAGHKVGVQRGSVYEGWLRTALVNTGQMPADNLFTYEKMDDAIRDLKDNRVDLVVLDAPVAQDFVNQGGVKLVGKGLNQQRLAFAVRKGETTLREQLNRALTELQNDGTVAALAKQYLNIDQLPPTPPPGPTSTPAPPPGCIDGLALVEHLTMDDKNMSAPPVVPGGQEFVKKWRVKNTGTCTWDGSYQLVFVHGDSMGGKPVNVAGSVAPDATYDVELKLVAPLTPGRYQGFWQMVNGQGVAFGERLPVGIQVPGGPTPTPKPTQTPAPGISFTVDRTNIKAGECVTFRWNVQNVKAVYFYPQGAHWPDHGVGGEGSKVECPPVTIIYELRVIKPDDSVDIRQITIYVEPVADAPQIKRFTVEPVQITQGQCVEIRWKVEGQVNRVVIIRDGTPLWDGAPTQGSRQDCPPGAGVKAYAIEAFGPGGTSRQQVHVNVVTPATATPAPTAAPEKPVIHAFSVSPNQIQAGESVGLSWSVGGGAVLVQIRRNGVVVIDNAGFAGQQMDIIAQPGSYVYRLEAYNAVGESVYQEATVNVSDKPPENPLANTHWQVTNYHDGTSMVPVLAGTTLTAQFGAGGALNGSAGCNTYSTDYVVQGANLTVGRLNISSMTCGDPPGIMDQEQAFVAALVSAGSFEIQGNRLTIKNAGGQAVLQFDRIRATTTQ